MTLYGFSPWALVSLVALAAAALYVLHRLRVRPERKPVPTLLFWKEAVEETRARTLFGRFRHPRTYVFLLALAALALLALAEPETATERAATRHLVLVVDTDPETQATRAAPDGSGSGSGNGTDADAENSGPRVFDRIRALALDLVDALADRDRVAVLTTVKDAPAVATFGESHALTRQRIAALSPARTAPDVNRTLTRAARLLAGRSHPHVILLTGPGPGDSHSGSAFSRATSPRAASPRTAGLDTAAPGARLEPEHGGVLDPGAVPFTVVRTRASGSDLALTGVRFVNPGVLLVRVQGRADERSGERTLEVRSFQDGTMGEFVASARPGDLRKLGSGVDHWVRVPGVSPDGGTVEIRLLPTDGNPANDRLVYVRPLRRTRAIRVDPGLPDSVRLLVESHPRLRLAREDERPDLMVRAAQDEALAEKPVAAGTRVQTSWFLAIRDGADVTRGADGTDGTGGTGGTDSADGTGGTGGTAGVFLPRLVAPVRPLLRRVSADGLTRPGRWVLAAGRQPLAWLSGTSAGTSTSANVEPDTIGSEAPRILEIAPDLLARESGFLRHAASAGWLARCLEQAAGNRGGSLVRPAGVETAVSVAGDGRLVVEGSSIRLMAGKDGIAALSPGSDVLRPLGMGGRVDASQAPAGVKALPPAEPRVLDTVLVTGTWPRPGAVVDAIASDPPPEVARAPFSLREWLLLILLALGLVDAWLHVKGRIP